MKKENLKSDFLLNKPNLIQFSELITSIEKNYKPEDKKKVFKSYFK